eukprot:3063762-Pyramimonas_sp.AAC.1
MLGAPHALGADAEAGVAQDACAALRRRGAPSSIMTPCWSSVGARLAILARRWPARGGALEGLVSMRPRAPARHDEGARLQPPRRQPPGTPPASAARPIWRSEPSLVHA